ncbi:hypothetical protein VKT23_017687 [Stygiomarasmius scandens]|uniref:Uncharacterized protein n=1 Tax=Marasmiellus scandens TaxID=2682957 RepID=A0ABR1IVI9_9AGAR
MAGNSKPQTSKYSTNENVVLRGETGTNRVNWDFGGLLAWMEKNNVDPSLFVRYDAGYGFAQQGTGTDSSSSRGENPNVKLVR